jgi:hypothetical protein
MTIKIDEGKFDKCQLRLLEEIARDVKSALEEAGVSAERIQDVTESITFQIAAIVDSSRVMELDGKPLLPFLTFAEDDKREQLIASPGGSWMHEYACGTVDQIFDEAGDE